MADRELKVRILGDARSAQGAVRDTEQAFNRFGPAGQKASSWLSKVQGHLDGLGPAGTKASKSLDSIVGRLGSVPPAASAAAAGVAVAGAAMVKFAVDGAAKFVALATEVRNFARASGATAEQASRMVAVLDDLGISSETGAAAISKLTRNADAGKLKPFNIEIERTHTGATDTVQTLLNVADAYSSTTDPAERARLRFAAFGKAGDALIPILEQGRAGLTAFFDGVSDSQLFSQDELDRAEEYRLALDNLGDTLGDLQRDAGQLAVGPLTVASNSLATFVHNAREANENSGGLGDVLKRGLAGPLLLVSGGMIRLGEDSDNLSAKQRELAVAAQGVIREFAEEVQALDDLANATIAAFNADIAHERALNNLEDASADVAEKQRELNDAIRGHGANSAQARAATEELSRAQLDQRDSALQVAASAAKLAEEQAKANEQGWDATRDGIPAQIAALDSLRETLAPGNPLRAALDGYVQQLDAIKKQIDTNVSLRFRAEGPAGPIGPGGKITLTVGPVGPDRAVDSSGRRIKEAAGGVVQFFAAGGEHHVAQIARAGDVRIWAEPETGGESYIPHANDWRRPRAVQVWRETGKKLGVQGFSGGGITGRSADPGGGLHVHFHGPVYATGGERELARRLRPALADELEANGITALSYKP